MVSVIDAVLELLRRCGIQAHPGAFRPNLIVIPVGPTTTLHAGPGPDQWAVVVFHTDGSLAVPVEQYDHRGQAVDAGDSAIEPIASDSTDAEAIAVFILRHLLRAGRYNRVLHAYVNR